MIAPVKWPMWVAMAALLAMALVWWYTGNALRALAVLVIATPCPLIIAIPISIMGAISLAARRGIIIKDPVVLELLPTCRTAIFDKTGTLTYGKPQLTTIVAAKGVAQDDILAAAASLARYSRHPLSNAIVQAAVQAKLTLHAAVNVAEKSGEGLTGTVGNAQMAVTSRQQVQQLVPNTTLPPTAAGLESMVMRNGHYAATLQFRDAPRAEGKSFIRHLAPSHQFNKIMLVSGDRESEVDYLAALLGIKHTLAAQSPEQKLAIVRTQTKLAPTLFMGDGINDAPALAAATVGGMALSVIGMGFAAANYISPVQAALLQEFIDVLAIANALRLGWGKRIATDFSF